MRAINLILNAKSVEGCKRMLRKQQHEVFLDDATNNREISKQSSSNVWVAEFTNCCEWMTWYQLLGPFCTPKFKGPTSLVFAWSQDTESDHRPIRRVRSLSEKTLRSKTDSDTWLKNGRRRPYDYGNIHQVDFFHRIKNVWPSNTELIKKLSTGTFLKTNIGNIVV